MKIIVAPKPIVHPDLGIESLISYLGRFASAYNVSTHQILRLLCESDEVSHRLGEQSYRAPSTRSSFSGYSDQIIALVRRLKAATDLDDPSAMTLIRLGPALSERSRGVIAQERKTCSKCLEDFNRDEGLRNFEPLIWSLATIDFCPIHKVPLQKALQARKDPFLSKYLSERRAARAWNPYEAWRAKETLALVSYCADSNSVDAVPHAPRVFLNEYMAARDLKIADFVQLTGACYGNLKRQLEGVSGVALKTVFEIAQSLAISPLNILIDPVDTARSNSLFDIRDHAQEVRKDLPKESHIHHPISVQQELYVRMTTLLSRSDPLPSLRHVCHQLHVSTGFARHHLKVEVNEYLKRRKSETARSSWARRRAVREEVGRHVAKNRMGLCIKKSEKIIRDRTHLPKHLLLEELRRVVRSKHSADP